MFDQQGHLMLTPSNFCCLLAAEPAREIANNYLMVGTPRVFSEYRCYCAFTRDLGKVLGVHCRAFIVRGSAHLGYSISPRPEKVWRPFGVRADGKLSDIDIAIVDADYFDRLDTEIRAWESRQHRPEPTSRAFRFFAERERLRTFGCINDQMLPPLTCMRHKEACSEFSTEPYCGVDRAVSAFIFRSWHALLSRWERDLGDLKHDLERRALPEPNEAMPSGDMPTAIKTDAPASLR